MGTIAHLPVRMGLTIQPIPEPERWHKGPYCYIYIAACENIDHFRTAIRALVNQIEGSGIGIEDDSTHGSDNGDVVSTRSTPMGSAKKTAGKPMANEQALERAWLAAGKTSFVLLRIVYDSRTVGYIAANQAQFFYVD